MGPSIHFLNLSAPHSGQDRFLGLELISLFGENHDGCCRCNRFGERCKVKNGIDDSGLSIRVELSMSVCFFPEDLSVVDSDYQRSWNLLTFNGQFHSWIELLKNPV